MHSQLYVRLMNSKAWRDTRNKYLALHPLCEDCKERGIVKAAQCVHHMVEVESGRTDRECEQLCFSTGNLRALCFACHSERHTKAKSHTKEAHRQRNSERLERWIRRVRGQIDD